ncbi:hypothetical protein [Thalassolituus sp.]|uniref:hypothetical protein n=1 Tax=Thalassolituus sp. TaxID=2030822 RepID=UPI003981AE5E
MNNKQWSFFDNSPIKILDLARFDKRITGKRKALGQSGIESAIKGGMLRRLFHFIGVIFGL